MIGKKAQFHESRFGILLLAGFAVQTILRLTLKLSTPVTPWFRLNGVPT